MKHLQITPVYLNCPIKWSRCGLTVSKQDRRTKVTQGAALRYIGILGRDIGSDDHHDLRIQT